MTDDQPVDFVAKLAELRAKKGVPPTMGPQPGAVQPATQFPDAVVSVDELSPGLSDAEKELDAFVNNIDIIDAYNKWCGKMRPDPGGKRESIMISCPDPKHADKDPSAWINLDKQTYYCGGCEFGGDIHEIAALNFGYAVPGHKQGENFHKLRQQMAESFGFRSKQVAGGTVTWVEEPVADAPAHAEVPESTDQPLPAPEETGNVAHMWAEDDEPDLVVYPTINWRNIVPEDTFLFEYLKATTQDDSPEEYHFWNGLLALGNAVGRKVYLSDDPNVYANLMVCILGNTGAGKSKSRRWLKQILRECAPHRFDGTASTGVLEVVTPGSGENLVRQLSYTAIDPVNQRPIGPVPVNAYTDFDELSALIARQNRTGSSMQSYIMQIADAVPEVTTASNVNGSVIAKEPFCNITASTQPKAIRALINRTDASSGFLNRWVFAGGKKKQAIPIGGKHSDVVIDLTKAKELFNNLRGWGSFEREIQMSEDGSLELYTKFFRENIEKIKERDDTDLLKRIDLLFKKLMLLLTINLKLEKVPLQVVEAVIEMFDYILECYGILNANIGITVMQDVMIEIQRHILRHMAKTKRGASANDIVRYTKRKNYSLEQIKKALDVMTALDMIEIEPKLGTMGRPTVRYRVVGE